MIDFEKTEKKVMPNFYGGDKEYRASMFTDEMNKIMKGVLIPGASIGFHKHETSSEIIFFLSGKGKVILEDGEERVEAGLCHYCRKGSSHSLVNDGDEDLIFYAVVPQQ